MEFKNLIKTVLAVVLITSSQLSYADEWRMIDHYQVKDDLAKDTTTGLMWMRCSLGQNYYGLMGIGMCQGDAAKYTWEQAINAAKSFDYAGYSDWRLPTIEELKSIVYCSSEQTKKDSEGKTKCDGDYIRPTIAQAVFLNTPDSWFFWSSSPVASNSNDAWIVSFYDGHDYWGNKYYGSFVRLVRGGQ